MNNQKIIENVLPVWFKEKYKLELENYKTAGRYWIRAEDIFQLIEDVTKEKIED